MAKIFVSHAHRDQELARAVANLLQLGCGVANEDILATSLEGKKISPGTRFNEFLQDELQGAPLVVQLLTPAFYESAFCLCEAGAAWALEVRTFPLLVPPLEYENVRGVIEGAHLAKIDVQPDLDTLRDTVEEVLGDKAPTAEWNTHRSSFLAALAGIEIPAMSRVPAGDFEAARSELEALRYALDVATFRPATEYDEDCEYVWIVDGEGDDDQMVWRRTTRVTGAGLLPWRRFAMGASTPAPSRATMDVRVETGDENVKVEALRIAESPTRVEYAVFFEPSIRAGQPVQWTVRFRWPGFWNVLRETGRDTTEFRVRTAGHHKLRMVLPPAWAVTRYERRSPAVGAADIDVDEEFGQSLLWDLGADLPLETYRAEIQR